MDKVFLGQRVYADKVYEWPGRDTWEDGAALEFAPVDNPLSGAVAVVTGKAAKKVRAELEYYCTGDGGATCGSEGYHVHTSPHKRTFIELRYTLGGRRYYTAPAYLRPA